MKRTMLSFALACAVLMLIPGPNVGLITAAAIGHGIRQGLLTVSATVTALAAQIALVLLGLSALLHSAGGALTVLRWAGVLYLIVLGVRAWRAPPGPPDMAPAALSARRVFARASLVVLTNPKTLLFISALFPQFVDPGRPPGPQLLALAAMMLAMEVLIDCGWAVLAGRAGRVLRGGLWWARWRGRVTGGLMIGAGTGLALARAD